MNGKGTGAMIDLIKAEAMEEFVAHRDKYDGWSWWGPKDNRQDITDKFNNAKNWATGRPEHFYKHIGTQWGLGSPVALTINKDSKKDLEITVNGIKLNGNVFDGKYFANSKLTINGGESVKGWRLTGGIKEDVAGSVLTIDMPKSSLKVEPLFEVVTGIEEVNATLSKGEGAVYDLQGRKVTTPQAGRIYIQNGKKQVWQ